MDLEQARTHPHNRSMALTRDEARQLVDQANAAYTAGEYPRAGAMFVYRPGASGLPAVSFAG